MASYNLQQKSSSCSYPLKNMLPKRELILTWTHNFLKTTQRRFQAHNSVSDWKLFRLYITRCLQSTAIATKRLALIIPHAQDNAPTKSSADKDRLLRISRLLHASCVSEKSVRDIAFWRNTNLLVTSTSLSTIEAHGVNAIFVQRQSPKQTTSDYSRTKTSE